MPAMQHPEHCRPSPEIDHQQQPAAPRGLGRIHLRLGPARLASALLLVLLGLPLAASAGETSCTAAAESWIAELEDDRKAELFKRYVRSDCEFSARWVKEYAGVVDAIRRDRMCTDLVLLWTHKDCNYFRDVINPEAYEPCKEWSREMYRHCLEDDLDWFP